MNFDLMFDIMRPVSHWCLFRVVHRSDANRRCTCLLPSLPSGYGFRCRMKQPPAASCA